MTIETTLLEQCYVKEEAGFGTLATPASTDAFRHHEATLEKKNNREPSPEKRGTPDRSQSLPRATDTKWDIGAAFWEPSGTIGTQSYLSPFLKNAFGTRTLPNLVTTVASSPLTTSSTLTSATGLTVGDCVVVTMPAGHREITRIKSIDATSVTWDALSVAPSVGAAVVSGVNYKLATAIASSLSIFKFHTAGGQKEAISGGIVNRVSAMFDGSKEVGIQIAGIGKDLVRTGFSIPGAFTTVGSVASGLIGNVYVGGTAFLVLSANVTIENKHVLRKGEIGTLGLGTAAIPHPDFREVRVSVTFYCEDTNLIDKADAVTRSVLRILVGNTNGAMVGCVLPSVEYEIPTFPASGGPKVITIEGVGYATNGNDQVYFAEI